MQPQAREKAQQEGFEVSVAKTSFKANTKALAENEGEGLAKVNLFTPINLFIFGACDAGFGVHNAFFMRLELDNKLYC